MNSSLLVRKANNGVATLLMIVGAMLLLVNVLLVQQNKKLRVLASRPDRALEARPGTALPPLEGIDIDGNRKTVNYGQDSRKTVLLVFSPRCSACEENMPTWDAIINGLDPLAFQIAAVSLQPEGVKEFASRRGISRIPILTKIAPQYRVAYNLALTPQIILIDSGGKVEKVWTGALRGEGQQDVELALNVRLP